MEVKLVSNNSEQTKTIALDIARNFKGGEVVELISDLGGGKTTFVHGLAKGIGSEQTVASPTFTISKIYKGQKLTIHHLDFYRLNDPGIMSYDLNEILSDKNNVVVIEWAGIVDKILPSKRLRVEFKPTAEDVRELTLSLPNELSYLMK